MRERGPENQQLMADRIVERFDAVDVTGLSRWEKERKLVKSGWYGLAAGERAPGSPASPAASATGMDSGPRRKPARPYPLFPDLEAA